MHWLQNAKHILHLRVFDKTTTKTGFSNSFGTLCMCGAFGPICNLRILGSKKNTQTPILKASQILQWHLAFSSKAQPSKQPCSQLLTILWDRSHQNEGGFRCHFFFPTFLCLLLLENLHDLQLFCWGKRLSRNGRSQSKSPNVWLSSICCPSLDLGMSSQEP